MVEHADSLDSLHRMGVLDEAVASRFSFSVLADLHRNHSSGETENVAELLVVDGESQLKDKHFDSFLTLG
jgi:hypothetical protein